MPPAAAERLEQAHSAGEPPSAAAFAAAMTTLGPFEDTPAIAVGVSGGLDSMALALLLRDWLAERGGSLLALVVDHRLRPESTAEAECVTARLAALGIAARTLSRAGERPASGLQAKAREARYALLEAAAAAAGILHLALAHHLADQAETVALRLASGSGPRGAAGMPAIREVDRVRLIRPLLGVAPGTLQALLQRHRVPWLEDPSNRDPRFWRARYRLGRPARPPATPPTTAATARQKLDAAAAALLARHARPHPAGFVTIEAAPLSALEPALAALLLGRLVLATSGRAWPPGRAELIRLAAWLQQGTGRRTALGGVLVERSGPALRFVREPRAVAAAARLPPEGMLWDGRFRITRRAPGPAVEVAAAGPGWRQRLARMATAHSGHEELMRLPAVVLETLPLVSADDRPLLLGSWSLAPLGHGLESRFRPRNRYAAVPFGQLLPALVASPDERLMYGSAKGGGFG